MTPAIVHRVRRERDEKTGRGHEERSCGRWGRLVVRLHSRESGLLSFLDTRVCLGLGHRGLWADHGVDPPSVHPVEVPHERTDAHAGAHRGGAGRAGQFRGGGPAAGARGCRAGRRDQADGPALGADVPVRPAFRGGVRRHDRLPPLRVRQRGHGLPGQRDSAASDPDALRVHGACSGVESLRSWPTPSCRGSTRRPSRSSRGMSGG